MKKLSYLLLLLTFAAHAWAQTVIDPSRAVIDESRKMIVCNEPLASLQNLVTPIQLSINGNIYSLPSDVSAPSYGTKYTASNGGNNYDLYLTNLPLLDLDVPHAETMNGETEIPGTMSLANEEQGIYHSAMAIKTRGNSSSFFPKKSYRVQLKDEFGKNKDASLLGLRSDKRWLLLAQWNEEIRANNVVSHRLWTDMHKLYYAGSEPKAISSIRTKYVEVFLNKSYLGVYAFAEDMDRKQLQLKKEESGVTKGELYKADDWSLSASFGGIGVPKAAPGSESWQSWELDYPDYTTWENHYAFLNDVIQTNDDQFKALIWNRMKIENVIDYYIFMNVMQAEDNLEKNYFLARYDQGEPYFLIPWDLDATWGYFPDGSRSNKYQDIKTNELFKRLIRLNPGDFNNKLATRWFSLRQNLLSEASLKGNFTANYNILNGNSVYERDNRVALDQYNNPDRSSGLAYLHQYISQRLPWLDDYFCPMLASGNCTPTAANCDFTPAPSADKQSYTPSTAAILQANCTGNDCGATTFTWSGNGLNATGATANTTVPSTPGQYTYTITATKNGCETKSANITITVVSPAASCDFAVTANTSSATPACSASITLSANCTGADCASTTYKWSGNGINASGATANINAPANNGTFTYTVTASKAGCADKTANTTITVSNCSTPSQPLSVCIESENAQGNGSVTSDPNAPGTRGDQNGSNQYVDYVINNVSTAGTYELKLRYAASSSPTISIAVNGTMQNTGIQIPATHTWNIVFREETIPVTLSVGNNTIRILAIGTNACRQDKICVTGNPDTPQVSNCDFTLAPTADKQNYTTSTAAILQANCTGNDCGATTFTWSGNGLNATGATANTTVPTTPGQYTYTVTATKNGCETKSYNITITVVSPAASCDFAVTANTSSATPSCSASITLSANCTGADCASTTYKWSGNGINASGVTANINAPANNGTFTYTVTASKAGCADKTANAMITVSNCNTPTQPLSVCIESENASGNGSVTSDPNASGTRGDQNGSNQYVDYVINNVSAAGTYELKLRYAASSSPTISIAVNNTIQNAGIQIPATHTWNIVFREETIPVTLSAGNNTIRILAIGSNACRQDKICVTGNPGTPQVSNCNFTLAPSADKQSYTTSTAAILQANCTGNDCGATTFTWSGNGLNANGATANFTTPSTPGQYTYTVTATKNGCENKSANIPITVVSPAASCDFAVTANASSATPACAASITLSANCTGADCASTTYKWSGNGINASGATANINAPATNGTFTYTVTASKAGCADKTANTMITVSNCNTPSQPLSVCIESENATGNGSVTDDPNASGKRTRGDQNGSNQYVDYEVNDVPAAGIYNLTLRYAASGAPTISIAVNGSVQNPGMQIPETHTWNIVFREETIPVTLIAGNNTVRILATNGSARQDKICVTSSPQNTRIAYSNNYSEQREEEVSIEPLAVSPNPAPGEFKVKFYIPRDSQVNLIVSDVLGNVLYSQAVKGYGNQTQTIKLSDKINGLVLLKLITKDKTEVKKLAIIR